MSLSIATTNGDNKITLVVSGEVDVSNAKELTAALAQAQDAAPALIDVNLAGVPYIDSTGIGVLVAAAHNVSQTGGELTVSAPQPNVLRVLTLLGVGSEFHVNEA